MVFGCVEAAAALGGLPKPLLAFEMLGKLFTIKAWVILKYSHNNIILCD